MLATMRVRPILLALLLLVPILAEARTRGAGSPGTIASRLRNLEAADVQGEEARDFALDGQFVTQLSVERLRGTETAYARSALFARLNGPAGFSLASTLRLEPSGAVPAGLVPRHTGYAETLSLRWTQDPIRLFAGKIHPRFGAAWARAPGLYGADYAADYELREKLGFGARLWLDEVLGLPDPLGTWALQAEAFQADTSLLSASAFAPRWPLALTDEEGNTTIRQRWRARRLMGGPDNRGGLPGVALTMVAAEMEVPGGQAAWNAGLTLRRPGQDALLAGRGATETGAVAGAEASFRLPGEFRLTPAAEYARRTGNGGYAGRSADWVTAALTLRRGALSLGYAWMQRRERDAATAERAEGRQHTVNATLDLGRATGFALLEKAAVSVDWRRRHELGERSQGVGVSLLYAVSF
jgi:hypothetical protein